MLASQVLESEITERNLFAAYAASISEIVTVEVPTVEVVEPVVVGVTEVEGAVSYTHLDVYKRQS